MPPRIRKPGPRSRHFIREWREYRNLTQAQLADRLQMSEASLSRIEGGKQPYTQDFLEACADALMTDPASLIMRRPGSDELWSLWERAAPGERQQITDFAGFVVKRTGRPG